MNHRERNIPFAGSTAGKLTVYHVDRQDSSHNTTLVQSSDNQVVLTHTLGAQITESESHPAWNTRKSSRPNGDLGGPFYSIKASTTMTDHGQRVLMGSQSYDPNLVWPNGRFVDTHIYEGLMLPMDVTSIPWPVWSQPSQSEMIQLGVQAIARCSPSNPSADLAVMAGELLKDGIPSIIGGSLSSLGSMTSKQRRKALSSEYLNYEFGWKPLVSDLQKTAKSIVDAHNILNNYERNSGRLVRRRYRFPDSTTTTNSLWRQSVSPWINPSSGGLLDFPRLNGGQVVKTSEVLIRQWFSGAFTYYVPPADSLRNRIARRVIQARKLLGLSLTPDTLWNLAPWSWMVDWFSDTGDILSNWTDWAIDNQVLVYGYVMDHRVHKDTYTFQGPNGFIFDRVMPPALIRTIEVKNRIQATPYGFGVDLSSLTGRQQTILAALGLNRKK
jgi:hypothetical protein